MTDNPRAVECHGHDSEYVVQRNSDKLVMSDAIVIPKATEHRGIAPALRLLGMTCKADALDAHWEQIDKDKADMAKAETQTEGLDD